jgi:hypothetical protein
MSTLLEQAIHSVISKKSVVGKTSGQASISATALLKELQNSFDMIKIKPTTEQQVSTTQEWIALIRKVCAKDPLIQQTKSTRYFLVNTPACPSSLLKEKKKEESVG